MPQHHYRQQGSLKEHLHHIHTPSGAGFDFGRDVLKPTVDFGVGVVRTGLGMFGF